jgi:hypothetical protein
MVSGAFIAPHLLPVSAQSVCSTCVPVGFGNSNYDFFPYQAQGSNYPTATMSVDVQISSTLSATGYLDTQLEGCSSTDQWTYQNNLFDPSGEFIQEVLAIGSSSATPSCFTVEWGPAGTSQVYNYMATEIPASYTTAFVTAGNSLVFAISGSQNELPNGEVNITSFALMFNGATVATLQPAEMLNYTTGQLLNGADGPVFYDSSTGQNFDIVGPGGGQAIVFTSAAGSMSYCGTAPQNPPEVGGLLGFINGGATTIETSNIFYTSPSSSSGSCSSAPTLYAQTFGITP